MADQWMLRGVEFSNCNCSYGCGCQFNAPSTNGFCEAMGSGYIEEGFFNNIRLDGLNYVMLLQWPGEIAQGNGTQQVLIDARANASQREALRKILHGEATTPGATHFFVFNSTMSNVLEPQFVPIDLSIDVDGRKATVNVPGLVESMGTPIPNPHTGRDHRARINLPEGFEYTVAEVGNGSTKAQAGIALNLSNSYGQFNILHMNQDGVIRV
ncbi:DUF1326 domain-containing protein [uncultured Nitrospira sp.]|uniref:DUF1326 domain-containing protein n=1 Tax=uncultured Nitrospira sp. TaxID=157176 RepID=UPI0031407132